MMLISWWWVKKRREMPCLIFWGAFVMAVFGGIHCIAWSFDFPSHNEQLLWRISSITITGIPLAFACINILLIRLRYTAA
jgi:hypothetical protein